MNEGFLSYNDEIKPCFKPSMNGLSKVGTWNAGRRKVTSRWLVRLRRSCCVIVRRVEVVAGITIRRMRMRVAVVRVGMMMVVVVMVVMVIVGR